LAVVAERLPALENRARPFQPLEQAGCLGKVPGRVGGLPPPKNRGSPKPSYGIIDAQSVKTQCASEERGIDGGKKVKGRKRHIVVDSQGHLLHVRVHAANLSDTKSACDVLEAAVDKHPFIDAFSGNAGYRGTAVEFTSKKLGLTLCV